MAEKSLGKGSSSNQKIEKKTDSKPPTWVKDPHTHGGLALLYSVIRMVFMFGLFAPEALALSVIFFVSAVRAKKGTWLWGLCGVATLIFMMVPDLSVTPRAVRVERGTLPISEEVQRDSQSITRGESQGADNASWSHKFGPEALNAFISPLEGQTEEQIEARTITIPGEGLVTVKVVGTYTYNSNEGLMTIDPAGGVVTLHGAVSQNPPTNNHEKFPAPQLNWGEMLYRPAGQQLAWHKGWQPVGNDGVELEAGKGYEFTLNVNQSNLEWFSIQNLTLYVP